MVSISEFKSTYGVVKGSIGTFAGLVFRDGCTPKTEIWNGYKVLAIDATDVEYIICEKPKKAQFHYVECTNLEYILEVNVLYVRNLIT